MKQNVLQKKHLTRRQFLVSASALAGGLSLRLLPVAGLASATAAAQDNAGELSPWLVIQPDDTVVVTVPTPEIGNGASTQQAMNIPKNWSVPGARSGWSLPLTAASIARPAVTRWACSRSSVATVPITPACPIPCNWGPAPVSA